MVQTAVDTLLSDTDPAPVEVVNAESASELLLVCEHAGRAFPSALGVLGVSEDVLQSHRCLDIGAEDVARGVAQILKAPLVIQRYSRLVIDCNRPPDSPDAIPQRSDNRDIPGNRRLSRAARAARVREIFAPMNNQICDLFEKHKRLAAFSVHSFTPSMGGSERLMQAGFLSRTSTKTAEFLRDHIAAARPDLQLAINAPYQIEDDTDWFIPRHAERRGLPHCLIEIRNDQIGDPKGVAMWVELLSRSIAAFMGKLR